MEPPIIKWRETRDGRETRWFVRGVYSDRLYGDVTYTAIDGEVASHAGYQRSFEASISDQAYQEMVRLADSIRSRAQNAPMLESGWRGLMAFGTLSSAKVAFRYYDGDERECKSAQEFLELIDLLRPHVDG